MQKKIISFAETASFSKLIVNYLNGDKAIEPFYNGAFTKESFGQRIKAKSNEEINRKILVDELKKQYDFLKNVHPAVRHNIEALQKENTFTITTGHQLCLFTGPLYTVYKIFTVINLAEQLRKLYPDYHFVPVFWMATEDHDFEEINHVHLFGKKLEWQSEKTGGMVGKLPAGGITDVIDAVKPLLGESENSKKIIRLLLEAYSGNNTLTEATRTLVNELFGRYGLVSLDADAPLLKSLFVPVLMEDVTRNLTFNAVNKTVLQMEHKGIVSKAQVTPREINVFYSEDGLRERAVQEGEGYGLVNHHKKWTRDELLTEINNHPEHFSPNVLLRPLYQEMILPNVAYIGGGAEVAYWLELKEVFDHFKIQMPALVLRHSAMIIDKHSKERMLKFGLTEKDLFKTENELIKNFVKQKDADGTLMQDMQNALEKLYTELGDLAASVDPTLKSPVNAELQKAINGLRNIESKIQRAVKQQNETEINQLKKLKQKLFPEEMLQERYENIFQYISKYGFEFLEILKENLNGFEPQFVILEEE